MGCVGLEPTTYGLRVRSSTIELAAREGLRRLESDPQIRLSTISDFTD